MKKDDLIDIQHISYTYPVSTEEEEGEKEQQPQTAFGKALDGVDLQVKAGQYICILGSNGSGKSTLARHLNALLIPDEGTVWIGDLSTQQVDRLYDIRAAVGMVFQNPDNQMVASVVEEEVAFGLENIGVPSEKIRERVTAALLETGTQSYAKDHPYYLSGGQKQRVAIAGILAMKPSCIVLDESTSMLDPYGREEILDTVGKLNREQGITIINITHFMEEAVIADQIFVMNEGKILLSGSPQTIFRHHKELKQAGLRLPVACQLVRRLRELGMDIPEDLITREALTDYLKHCL